jgi:predicted O-methyltransferase YrrM
MLFDLRRVARKYIRRPAAVREALTIPGQITLEESRFLGSVIRELDSNRPIIEVGTLFGWSTRVIALYKPQGMELITVDAYKWNPLGLSPEHHAAITTNILEEASHTLNVKQVRQDKNDFYNEYSGPEPSLIFLDADHSYAATRQDLEWATKYRRALICLHDYGRAWPGVVKAVDELGGPYKIAGSLCLLTPGACYSEKTAAA